MEKLLKHLENKQHILWDWNGTLLNDVDLCVEIINRMLQRNHLNAITREEYRNKFRFPIIEYYRTIGFDLQSSSFEVLAAEFMADYLEAVPECPLFDGTIELLEALKSAGKSCSILSAAREAELKALAARHGIDHHFDHICGLQDHYAVSKIERGRELLQNLGISKNATILVGDTDHDQEVATALGVDLLLLGDGHQSYERLRSLHALTLSSRYL